MNSSVTALAIDIAKLKFDVCLINLNGKLKHKVFLNTASGFEQLARWLDSQKAGEPHVCLEATGTYGEALALYLHEAGYLVSVVNPAAIKAFAEACCHARKPTK
jgi:transposase